MSSCVMKKHISQMTINKDHNTDRSCSYCTFVELKFKFNFKLSFIVIPLHVWTYSGNKAQLEQGTVINYKAEPALNSDTF